MTNLPHYKRPSIQDYAKRVEALRPVIEKFSGDDDKNRIIHPEVVAGMREAGFFKLMQPWRLGGAEAPLSVSNYVVRELSALHASAGWVLMAQMGHAFMLGAFPIEAQDEVKHDDPDTVLGGGAAPTAVAIPVEGGYRVTGRCPFASGINHSVWTVAGARVQKEDPENSEIPDVISVLVPPSDFTVDDDWFTLGLKATGSKTVVLDDVFVPAHRAMDQGAIALGHNMNAYVHTTSLYTLPSLMIMACAPAANILGVAERLLEDFVDTTKIREDKYFATAKALSPGLQMRTAESTLDLRACRLLLDRITSRMDHFMFDVTRPSLEEKAQIRYGLSYIVAKARTAAGRVYDAAGGNAAYDRSPLQKFFRDIHMGSHHATMDHDHSALQFGRVRLGLKPELTI